MNESRTIRPQLALEMTMRDVLGNMEEMISEYAFRDMGGEFEIISIKAAEHNDTSPPESRAPHIRELFSARVLPLPVTAARVA